MKIMSLNVIKTQTSCYQKILRLDVSIDQVFGMDELHEVQRLDGDEQDGLERELPAAGVEQVLQTWPEQLHDERVVFAADAEVVDLRQALAAAQLLVKSGKPRNVWWEGLKVNWINWIKTFELLNWDWSTGTGCVGILYQLQFPEQKELIFSKIIDFF